MRTSANKTVGRAAVALVIAIGLAACSSSSKSSGSVKGNLSGTLKVFLGSSLTKAFTAFGQEFEAAHPGTKVELNPASSTTLAAQIQGGADADKADVVARWRFESAEAIRRFLVALARASSAR